jgi:Ca-activated chloride channel family protein
VFDFFQNIHFVQPFWLVFLLVIPLLDWFSRRRWKYFDPALLLPSVEAVGNHRTWKTRVNKLLPYFRLLALAALVLALARPQRTLKEEDVKAEGIDIMLAIDLSSSMLARDFQPDRLEASKVVAEDFINKRPYDRFGLVAFSGEAFTQCPLTTDHRVVKEFLAGLQCGFLEDGTAIGMGLATAVNRIKDSPAKSKVVILLTDGVNNAGYIQPLTAAEIAQEFDVKVYTIGVGSTGEALTPVRKRPDGRFVFGLARVEIDEGLLREISKMTDGQYFRATSEQALVNIYNEIDRLEKTEIDITTFKRYSDEFHWFIAIALLILMLEFLLRTILLKRWP